MLKTWCRITPVPGNSRRHNKLQGCSVTFSVTFSLLTSLNFLSLCPPVSCWCVGVHVCVACSQPHHLGLAVLIYLSFLFTLLPLSSSCSSSFSFSFCSCVKMLNLWWVPLCSSTSDSWDREWTSLGWAQWSYLQNVTRLSLVHII